MTIPVDKLDPLFFEQCVLRAIKCLENNERVVIELAYDNVLVGVRKIYVPKPGYPIACFKRWCKIHNENVERTVDLTPKTIKSFFFQ